MRESSITAALHLPPQEGAEQQERNRFWLALVLCMSAYTVSLRMSSSVTDDPWVSGLVTNAMILLFALVMVGLILKSARPRRFFGLVLNPGWRAELKRSVGVSIVLVVLITAAKAVAVALIPALRAEPILDMEWITHGAFTPMGVAFLFTYPLLVPVQELCARGVLQSSFQDIYAESRFSVLIPVLLSNAIFAAAHAHISPWFSLMTFLPGLMWGWLYARQRSLLGVSVSHALVGIWAVKILGLGLLSRTLGSP